MPPSPTSQVRAATIAHGLHFPGGHISSVGISGFILGEQGEDEGKAILGEGAMAERGS